MFDVQNYRYCTSVIPDYRIVKEKLDYVIASLWVTWWLYCKSRRIAEQIRLANQNLHANGQMDFLERSRDSREFVVGAGEIQL